MEEQNPWWKGKEHIQEDEDFIKWKESRFRWIPKIISEIKLEPFSLHFLFGPRQAGKTTAIKLLIKDLLERINPKAIFYFRCDKLADFKELDEIIKEYLRIKNNEGIKSSFIFLDEITYVDGWYRTIKWHIDMGNFKRDVLLLTGSLSMYVRGDIETFPGRRGHGKDFIMYPLSFRDFIKVVRPGIIKKIQAIKNFSDIEIKKISSEARPWINELNELFYNYLETGGYPLSIKDFFQYKKIREETKNVYLSWIRGDLARLKRNESIAKRVLKGIIQKAPNAISLHGLAKEFEIKSHKTVFEYIDILKKLFLLNILYYIDLNKGTEIFYKQRKIHLGDPFLYKIFSEWCLIERPRYPIIVESVVASHLARKYKIGYWKNRKEIDIIVLDEDVKGVEVKWSKKPEFRKAKIGKMKKIINLTKDRFDKENLALPVSAFLAGLDV